MVPLPQLPRAGAEPHGSQRPRTPGHPSGHVPGTPGRLKMIGKRPFLADSPKRSETDHFTRKRAREAGGRRWEAEAGGDHTPLARIYTRAPQYPTVDPSLTPQGPSTTPDQPLTNPPKTGGTLQNPPETPALREPSSETPRMKPTPQI